VGCNDIRTDLRRVVPVPKEAVDALTSESSFAGGASDSATAAGAGADGGVGVGESSRFSRTVRNDAIDPLSLPSSSSSLFSLPLITDGAAGASTTTRGGAEGITIGFTGGVGGGDWARSALRSGIFGGVPAGAVIGARGGGGRDVGRWDFERDEEAGGCAASTLPGASTDSNEIPCPPSPRRLYFVTDGGARTLTNPPTGPAPLPGSLGRPEVERSHAARLSRVTFSTIAKSEFPARPVSACEGGGSLLTCKVEVLFPWDVSELLRLRLDLDVDWDDGISDERSPGPEILGTGGTLSELRRIPCRGAFVLEERESVSTRRSVLGFAFGLARVGVEDPDADTNDGVPDARDAERLCADVEGGAPDNGGRCFIEPLRAPRPATVAPSLIHPSSLSFTRVLRFLSFCDGAGAGEGEGGAEMSCDTRRPNNRRLGDSVMPSSSLSLSAPRRAARKFASVRVLHFSAPGLLVFPLPRNSPAMLLKNPPLPLRSRSGAGSGTCDKEMCVEDCEGGRVDDVCWVNDPVPVPVPLLVVLLPLLSRGRGPRIEKRRAGLALEVEALAPTPDLNRTFSTTSTGRESSSLELSPSCSSVMRLSIVDGRANSDIEWAGGIWRVIEDSGMPVYGEDDRGGKGEGLAARGGVLQLVLVRRVTRPLNHTRC
jgi:hypothetical protein